MSLTKSFYNSQIPQWNPYLSPLGSPKIHQAYVYNNFITSWKSLRIFLLTSSNVLKHILKTSQDHFHFTFPQSYDILKKAQIIFINACKNPKSFHVDIAVIHRVHTVFPSMFPLIHLKLRTRFSVPLTSLKQAHRKEDADGTLVVTSWLEPDRKIFSELIFEPGAHVCGDGEVKHPNFSKNFTNSEGKFACS
jgi:hypothetical protein